MWVFLLCMALVACSLVQVARLSNPSIQFSLLNVARNQHKSTLIVDRWQFASAHGNIALLAENRQRTLAINESAVLLIAQSASPALSLILPLLALFTGFALARSTQGSDESSRTLSHQPALWMGMSCLSVPLIIGVFLVIEAHVLGIPLVWASWSRILVWLGCVGTYFPTFLFFGAWISRRTRHTKTAAWIFLSLFVAFFVIQGSRELVMRIDGSALPPVPELPTEVRLSLFRPSGEPRVIPEREQMVADYLESVDAYSESVHAVVASRYQLERWWHVVSPQLLLSEISSQLLQTQLADIVDVIVAPKSEDKDPSLVSSLMSVGPEIAWLAILCCIAGLGSWFTARKREISQ